MNPYTPYCLSIEKSLLLCGFAVCIDWSIYNRRIYFEYLVEFEVVDTFEYMDIPPVDNLEQVDIDTEFFCLKKFYCQY